MESRIKVLLSVVLVIALMFGSCANETKKTETLPISDTKESSIINKKDSFGNRTEEPLKSEITCPKCGNKKSEILPTEVCLISYTCEKCKTVLHPKDGDCCVFCTYGDHKCPSKQ